MVKRILWPRPDGSGVVLMRVDRIDFISSVVGAPAQSVVVTPSGSAIIGISIEQAERDLTELDRALNATGLEDEDVEVIPTRPAKEGRPKEDRRRFVMFDDFSDTFFVNSVAQMHTYMWREFEEDAMQLWVEQAQPGNIHMDWNSTPPQFMVCVDEKTTVDSNFVSRMRSWCKFARTLCSGG